MFRNCVMFLNMMSKIEEPFEKMITHYSNLAISSIPLHVILIFLKKGYSTNENVCSTNRYKWDTNDWCEKSCEFANWRNRSKVPI